MRLGNYEMGPRGPEMKPLEYCPSEHLGLALSLELLVVEALVAGLADQGHRTAQSSHEQATVLLDVAVYSSPC